MQREPVVAEAVREFLPRPKLWYPDKLCAGIFLRAAYVRRKRGVDMTPEGIVGAVTYCGVTGAPLRREAWPDDRQRHHSAEVQRVRNQHWFCSVRQDEIEKAFQTWEL